MIIEYDFKTSFYNYRVNQHKNTCEIYNNKDEYLGYVEIDHTGAWTPHYQTDVNYLPINEALKCLGYPAQEPIFTSHVLERGQVFDFYGDIGVVYDIDQVLKVWSERDNNGLGEKIIYGKARVIETPRNPSGIYKGMIVG